MKDVVEFDREHGRYYVDAVLFDPDIDYDSAVYITEEHTGRNKKYEK